MPNAANNKRGGNPDIKDTPAKDQSSNSLERQLEEGLEETMNGSDPVSVVQPAPRPPQRKPRG